MKVAFCIQEAATEAHIECISMHTKLISTTSKQNNANEHQNKTANSTPPVDPSLRYSSKGTLDMHVGFQTILNPT